MINIPADITQIRNQYQEIYEAVHDDNVKNLKHKDISVFHDTIKEKIQKDVNRSELQNTDELFFYQEKTAEVMEAWRKGGKQKLKVRELNVILKNILTKDKFLEARTKNKKTGELKYKPKSKSKPKQTSKRGKQLPEEPLRTTQSKIVSESSQIALRRLAQTNKQTINSYFREKQSSNQMDLPFKAVLETAPVANRAFKKKIVTNNKEIQELKSRNYELKQQLTMICPDGNISFSQNQELKRIENRLMELEEENEKLYRENNRLKSEQSNSTNALVSNFTVEEMLDAQYVFFTLQNDLQKINSKFQNDGLSNYYPKNSDYDVINNRLVPRFSKIDALSQIKESNNEFGNSASFYEMSRSYFSEYPADLNQSYRLGIDNQSTVRKNKIAFFKQSGVLVRDKNADIAFKRLTDKMISNNIVKLYIYLNDQTGEKQEAHIDYQYETNYLDITKIKEISSVQKFDQARQVIEIRLKPEINNINTHATALIQIGSKTYKIWIPIIFGWFKPYSSFAENDLQPDPTEETKSIRPHQAFSTPQQAQKSIPHLEVKQNQGRLWIISRDHSGPLFLKWKSGNQLEIRTSGKWIDAFSFILLEYG